MRSVNLVFSWSLWYLHCTIGVDSMVVLPVPVPHQLKSPTLPIRSHGADSQPQQPSRRNLLLSIVGGVTTLPAIEYLSLLSDPSATIIANAASNESSSSSSSSKSTFRTYQVQPDAGKKLNPTLTSLTNESFLSTISSTKGGAVWLGEHHNSVPDHTLQVNVLRELSMRRQRNDDDNNNNMNIKMAVGLEQVQVQFQPVLDQYSKGQISLDEMRHGVEWDTRWIWPFEGYAPVFEAAQELGISLVALNVNSEDMNLVEKGGFPGLGRDRLKLYISDGIGFDSFSRQQQFRTYVNYVIMPSYELHQSMGLLQYTMSGEKLPEIMPFRNFLSGRLLWDEAMATKAVEWTRQNLGGLIVGLVGADHVKFSNGIPGRFARIAGDSQDCISVMLNPTLIDTRPPGTVAASDDAMTSNRPNKITLQLRYLKDNVDDVDRALPESTGGVMPLADFILIGA